MHEPRTVVVDCALAIRRFALLLLFVLLGTLSVIPTATTIIVRLLHVYVFNINEICCFFHTERRGAAAAAAADGKIIRPDLDCGRAVFDNDE